MGRKIVPRKYGTPLYCAAWPAGEHLYVAGGGGKKSSGIPNRRAQALHITPITVFALLCCNTPPASWNASLALLHKRVLVKDKRVCKHWFAQRWHNFKGKRLCLAAEWWRRSTTAAL